MYIVNFSMLNILLLNLHNVSFYFMFMVLQMYYTVIKIFNPEFFATFKTFHAAVNIKTYIHTCHRHCTRPNIIETVVSYFTWKIMNHRLINSVDYCCTNINFYESNWHWHLEKNNYFKYNVQCVLSKMFHKISQTNDFSTVFIIKGENRRSSKYNFQVS